MNTEVDANAPRMTVLLRTARTPFFVLLLGLVCASLNLNKAVHIDDTAYLKIAQAILADPLRPMSQQINWHHTSQPIHNLNQPHALFYLMALALLGFGESETALHAMMALLVLFTIVCFYALARLLIPRHALWITSVLVLGPGFLPAQNLMVDVPLLGLWSLFFWGVLRPPEARADFSLAVSAFASAVACLIKYVSLILLPILILVIVIRRRWRSLWVVAIPAMALVGWSLLNYLDYGGIHILERETQALSIPLLRLRSLDWIAGLGAVAVFSPFFISRVGSGRLTIPLMLPALAVGISVFYAIDGGIRMAPEIRILWAVFGANGVLTLTLVVLVTARGLLQNRRRKDHMSFERNLVLVAWLSGVALFVVLFATFMAIRHILPALAAVLLLVGLNVDRPIPARVRCGGLVASALLGLMLSVSDYHYADVYRRYAGVVRRALPSGARIWYAGHWGWQWYAEKQGMQQYDTERTVLRDGDYLVFPEGVHRQPVTPEEGMTLNKIREWRVPSKPSTWLRTMGTKHFGGYYSFSFSGSSPPLHLSRTPLEVFLLWKVARTGH